MGKWDNENEGQQTDNANHGFFEKVLNLFGFEAEEIIEEEENSSEEPYRKDPKERGKLVSLTNSNLSKNVKLLIIEPVSFDEVQTIIDHLRSKRAIIINLEETDKAVARRIADSLSGAIYALEGTMQRISGSIFLFTPPHIEVTVPIRSDFKENEKVKEREWDINKAFSASSYFKDRER